MPRFEYCFNDFVLVLQILYVEDEQPNQTKSEDIRFLKWLELLKDKKILITTCAICICTSTMAILEPCVPMWLLAHLNPPPSRWQLGAVFIPDSIGYFIGSHFAGK